MTDNSKTAGVALVTGASRGVGRGIAEALGAAGMTVYVTGRSTSEGDGRFRGEVLSGTVFDSAQAVTDAGGQGIAVRCDHGDDAQVQALFDRIEREQGRLDILVNNAAHIDDALIAPGPFWEKPLSLAEILNVGLRSAYVTSYYAAPLLLRAEQALVAFTSSYGAGCYMHGPAYGAQKAGCDKMAADMAVDFEGRDVAAVSLWLGPQLTQRSALAGSDRGEEYWQFLAVAETPQFNGRVIHALWRDPELAMLSGQTLISAELAQRYGIRDTEDRQPPSWRDSLGAPKTVHPARVG
ncbi:MAG TPA: SDR family NAD(P)-dependent oxidoreductase [Aromatoleum sp.]|uniref:SDR family NAD(P)-dependent oxidoreductase n=1 Tax=Aromatoleum sp. TaxID=2307007 RepID=UPI002B47A951|nr:SDR family NAD(P)-dependent oxidoreductase [Aromatoleum sp.]HJV27644.1 SDR family NAD(P)-dependent oxidoreductase [Aromatoleum sp.]